MKGKGLLSLITYSEKRKDLLFLIDEKPRTLFEIKEFFNVKTPEIYPRIKELLEADLIQKTNNEYYLTPIGKVILKYYTPLVEILNVFEETSDFWTDHDTNAIPHHLLERFNELENCILFQDPAKNVFEQNKIIVEKLDAAKKISGIVSVFMPSSLEMFQEMVTNKAPSRIIMTQDVYDKFRLDYKDLLQSFLALKDNELYLIDSVNLFIITTDAFLYFSLFYKNGLYDAQKYLVATDSRSLNWGNDCFKYFVEHSKKVDKLE
ncbi:winged helix-turn-helix domain-containing protein [Methanimicrococcus sp. OttesenSCG-928-J09]|nr:winged helix-turn-helix domain-containing protein [Methanimicrococcus sp. OttesenSCG-928-J09]